MNKAIRKQERIAGMVLGLSCLGLLNTCNPPGFNADMVLLNGNILTVSADQPRAEACAILHGKFVFVGSNEEAKKFIGDQTTVMDVTGKTIIPGFNDCHLHTYPFYPFEHPRSIIPLGGDQISSMDDLIALLRKKAEITPEGQWIIGSRYQDDILGRHPDRLDLDKVSTKHPISITHSSGHVSVVNTYALKAARINRNTPDPPGGAFVKDENDEPNGICQEGAGDIVMAAIPYPEATKEEELEGMQKCMEEYHKHGITSISEAGGSPAKLELFQKLYEQGVKMRISVMITDQYLEDLKKLKIRGNFGNDYVKIASIKVFHGNSLSGRTCWLKEPYDMINPETGKKDYYGIPPGRSQEELDELVYNIHEAGFQAAIHSNGDREIPMVLEAYEKALKKIPREDHRHRIEHCSVVDDAILDKIKELGIFLATHSYIYEHGDKMKEYGEARWKMMHPNKSALDLGIPIGGNSDSGVSPAIPLLRIQSMVTRKTREGNVIGSEQIITPEQAVYAWTMGSAFSSFDEDVKGSIEPGKFADFVVLSADPLETEREKIKDILVEATYIDGTAVYRYSSN